jgi:hypothetical protein
VTRDVRNVSQRAPIQRELEWATRAEFARRCLQTDAMGAQRTRKTQTPRGSIEDGISSAKLHAGPRSREPIHNVNSPVRNNTMTRRPLPNPFAFAPKQLAQIIYALSWLTSGTGQFGFINISGTGSSKPEVGADIIENVATYGR